MEAQGTWPGTFLEEPGPADARMKPPIALEHSKNPLGKPNWEKKLSTGTLAEADNLLPRAFARNLHAHISIYTHTIAMGP